MLCGGSFRKPFIRELAAENMGRFGSLPGEIAMILLFITIFTMPLSPLYGAHVPVNLGPTTNVSFAWDRTL